MTDFPPGYIDPEHTGADRHLLQAFYRGCQSEGRVSFLLGTADEINLRGIRAVLADAALTQPELQGPTLEPRGCPIPGACSCPTMPTVPPELIRALELAEAALADIGDAEREPGDDLAWAEARAAQDLPRIRAVLARWGRSAIEPVPVSERPWEKGGWLDLDGECWWCPPHGPLYWSMANPAMVYGGWVLPAHALPVPISQGETHHD